VVGIGVCFVVGVQVMRIAENAIRSAPVFTTEERETLLKVSEACKHRTPDQAIAALLTRAYMLGAAAMRRAVEYKR
jgi:hypothetical protein